ncbi:MAG TPA: DUF1737 domain-containing protein [Gemmata sp.]
MYIILENDDALRLAAAVQQHMTKGWKPTGGVSCYYDPKNETVWYVQALVREPSGSA